MNKIQKLDIAMQLADYSELLLERLEQNPTEVLPSGRTACTRYREGLTERMELIRGWATTGPRWNDVFFRFERCSNRLSELEEQG